MGWDGWLASNSKGVMSCLTVGDCFDEKGACLGFLGSCLTDLFPFVKT